MRRWWWEGRGGGGGDRYRGPCDEIVSVAFGWRGGGGLSVVLSSNARGGAKGGVGGGGGSSKSLSLRLLGTLETPVKLGALCCT